MDMVISLFALLVIVGFGLALIGVPVLLKRTGRLTDRVATLEFQLKTLHSVSSVDHTSLRDSDQLEVTADEKGEQITTSDLTEQPAETHKIEEANIVDKVVEASSVTEPADVRSQNHVIEDTEPTAIARLLNKLLSMNVTAQIGAVVLIFGTIFLGKYASDVGILTMQAKLVLMGGSSLAISVVGMWFADRLKIYGEILQGTGLAGWLVTWFAAHVLYDQVGWVVTLVANVLGVAVVGFRALKQDSQILAIIAYLGGFLTPFIASSEASSLWRLFGYMLVLNGAVILTAMNRPWRWLIREAYVFSFGLFAGLMVAEHLQNDLSQWVIQLPMVLYISLLVMGFSFLGLWWLQTQKIQFVKNASGLLFAVPAAAVIGYQGLFHDQSTYIAICLVVMGLWYALLAWYSRSIYFIAIAVISASMAIPFALNDALTSLVYSIEGAAFVVWSCKFGKRSGFAWGSLLQVVAAVFAMRLFTEFSVRETQLYLSWWLHSGIVLAALVSAWFLFRSKKPFVKYVHWIELSYLGWALIWWLYHWGFWLAERYTQQFTFWYFILMLPILMVSIFTVSEKLKWPTLLLSLPVLTVVIVLSSGFYLDRYANSVPTIKALVLAFVLIGMYALRYFQSIRCKRLKFWDALIVWFTLPALASISLYNAPSMRSDWNWVLAVIIPLGLMLFLQKNLRNLFHPVKGRQVIRWFSLGVLLLLTLSTIGALGNYAPLPFWPLLHPLVLLCVVAFEIFYRYARHRMSLIIVLAFWGGALITIELNRWLFHYAGVQFTPDAWVDSGLTQTVWSLVWSVLGAALMVSGSRIRHSRRMWVAGAIVLGLVVVKLFLLDLSQVDTLYRILSFIGVGSLLLAVGYAAPIPEDQTQDIGLVKANNIDI